MKGPCCTISANEYQIAMKFFIGFKPICDWLKKGRIIVCKQGYLVLIYFLVNLQYNTTSLRQFFKSVVVFVH
jgi:hypothetical protein